MRVDPFNYPLRVWLAKKQMFVPRNQIDSLRLWEHAVSNVIPLYIEQHTLGLHINTRMQNRIVSAPKNLRPRAYTKLKYIYIYK